MILGGPQAEATVLTEQFAGAPPALAEPVHEIARDLAPIPVPALDWLPSQRARPRPALPAGQHIARPAHPGAPRPALALEDRAVTCPHVRFAHLSRLDGHSPHELSLVVAYAFADVLPPRTRRA